MGNIILCDSNSDSKEEDKKKKNKKLSYLPFLAEKKSIHIKN